MTNIGVNEKYLRNVSLPWKQRVHGSEVEMTNIGIYKSNLVIWGELEYYENAGFYRPYIVLASFVSLIQTRILQSMGAVECILDTLKLYIRDYKAFVESKVSDELKDILAEISMLFAKYFSPKFNPLSLQDLCRKTVQQRPSVVPQNLPKNVKQITGVSVAGYLSSTA